VQDRQFILLLPIIEALTRAANIVPGLHACPEKLQKDQRERLGIKEESAE